MLRFLAGPAGGTWGRKTANKHLDKNKINYGNFQFPRVPFSKYLEMQQKHAVWSSFYNLFARVWKLLNLPSASFITIIPWSFKVFKKASASRIGGSATTNSLVPLF